MQIDGTPTGTLYEWADLTAQLVAGMVADRHHFALAAYRDGEWYAITGTGHRNVNGEKFVPELRQALADTLLHPVGQWVAYWWETGTSKGVRAKAAAEKWLAEHKPDVRILADRPVMRAHTLGMARSFWQAVNTRPVIIVGPRHIDDLDRRLVHEFRHVVVPDGVAWKHRARLVAEINDVMHTLDEPLVLFAAGTASCLMIYDLWPYWRGRATLYDIGSCLDPYCGVASRGEYRAKRWAERYEQNLP